MVNLIKKVLAHRQVRQVQKHRLENNQRQLKLIYDGLIERGY